MSKLQENVHGEGNKEADRQFREAESKFVRMKKANAKSPRPAI